MSTLTKKPATKKTSRKVVARKPVARGVVQGSLAGTATLAASFDPAAPAFAASDWKHSNGK
jgi:hypothetical protein